MCLETNCGGAIEPFLAAHEVWSRLNDACVAAYQAQAQSKQWNEEVTDELAAVAEAAFDEALVTLPQTLTGLSLYVGMLLKHGVSECPEAIEVALATLHSALETLIAAEQQRSPASRS